ncbi:putative [histone H3]-lysine(4) N-trimethyltransferase [Helianthus annuus]|nr:putative [histone H3]-lysine(4) N-trimethyltransferase [Helianthus annuus]
MDLMPVDWLEPSRPSPPSIQALLTESAGRGVFATRSIEPGQLIHTAKPFEQAKGFYEVEKEADWSTFVAHCRNRGLKYLFLAKRLAYMVISGVTSADSLDILQPARLPAEVISQMEEELYLLGSSLEDSGVKDEQLTFLNIECCCISGIRSCCWQCCLSASIFL